MSVSRRQFIQGSTAVLCTSAMPFSSYASQQLPLPVPPLLEANNGQLIFLTLQSLHWSFTQSARGRIWGINGNYPGPTVRVYNGDDVKPVYSNHLELPITMTVCGLQVSGSLTGGPMRLIQPGTEWAPVLPIRQPAATLWYRASTPGNSARQVYKGLLGMWIVEDSTSKTLSLPSHYGVDDFPVIIQDKHLDLAGISEYKPPVSGGFLGNTLLANGVPNPYLSVSRGWIRLRLLNASNARRYLLQTSDNRPMHVIASDQQLLNAPVPVQKLSLAPGERREILLDMSNGKPLSLISGETASLVERLRGIFEPSSVLLSNVLLTLKPDGLLPLVTSQLPDNLPGPTLPTGLPLQTRQFSFDDTPGINGRLWDPRRIDVTTWQNSFERWIIQSDNPQSFHLEGARFQIISINGAPPFPEDRGWKDTVWIDGQAELLVYFPNISQTQYPLIYASQTLELADRGSMGQILVQPANHGGG